LATGNSFPRVKSDVRFNKVRPGRARESSQGWSEAESLEKIAYFKAPAGAKDFYASVALSASGPPAALQVGRELENLLACSGLVINC
jgi:hypothetical protein